MLILVSNLPKDGYSFREFAELIDGYDPVLETQWAIDDAGEFRGFAYVRLLDGVGPSFIERLHGMTYDGRRLRVKEASEVVA